MNKVMLIGRLTKDPEVTYTTGENAMAVVRFTIAINRPKKKDGTQEADFIACKCFGKRAEAIGKYFSKGNLIGVTGSWQTGSYEKDGKKVFTNECIVGEIDFINSQVKEESNVPENSEYDSSYMSDDDDLPF